MQNAYKSKYQDVLVLFFVWNLFKKKNRNETYVYKQPVLSMIQHWKYRNCCITYRLEWIVADGNNRYEFRACEETKIIAHIVYNV